MKKIYSVISFAAACALTASAASPRENFTVAHPIQKVETAVAVSEGQTRMAATSKVATTKSITTDNIEGTYFLRAVNTLLGGTAPNPVTISVKDAATGAVEITLNVWSLEKFVVPATFNAEKGTLTLDNMTSIGKDSYGDHNYFYIKMADGGSSSNLLPGAAAVDNPVGYLNGDTFEFPIDEFWAVGDPTSESMLPPWVLMYDVKLTKYDPEADPNKGWRSLGNALIEDGWLSPCFYKMDYFTSQTEPDQWYEAEIQQNLANQNLFRIVDPFKGDYPYTFLNEWDYTGYITFDVSDPDHVIFTNPVGTSAGFKYEKAWIGTFYACNFLGYYCNLYLDEPENIIANFEDKIPYTTYKENSDGNMEVYLGFGPNGKWDAIMGIDDPVCAQRWETGDFEMLNMESRIIFAKPSPLAPDAAIETIGESYHNQPVEYFTIDGMRVENPVAGQLVIKRQGSKVTKQFIR